MLFIKNNERKYTYNCLKFEKWKKEKKASHMIHRVGGPGYKQKQTINKKK